MTPTLATDRLTLRHLTKATPEQVRWLNDPEVMRYSEQRHQHHTQYSQMTYLNSFKEGSHIWAILRIDSKKHIGNITATYDAPNRLADVGILIGEATHWGAGYGGEAWNAVCNWLLDKDGGNVRKLEAGCMRANEAMMKIIAKSNFQHEGDRANHFLLGGNPVSAALFGRFR
jgi:[ribosomal protein S5]-alanine N-acetyltransferase